MKRVSRYLWIICFLAALFALAGTLKASLPQIATGTWTSWTTLSQARANASSVLLPDGRILIEGGDSGGGPLQSAEIFATDGTVSSATSMNVARSHHFAVALSDGRVLVGGGITSGGGTTNSAEIYDPAADSWASVPAMITARANATAVLLQDGRVFIAGGDNAGATDNTIEIYDPTTGNFSFAGQLSSPRTMHAMAVLHDGRVLIVGGSDGNNPLASSDIFDPASGIISAGPALATARYGQSATTLLDGRIAIIGGTDGTNDFSTAEVFDPANAAFTNAGAVLATARRGHQAFLLPNNNSVLIVGGTSGGAAVGASELFVPQISPSGVWSSSISATGSNVTPRSAAVGSAMQQDGLLLAVGGNDASGNTLAGTELYAFPTVKTDQPDYSPGSIVTITGSGWQPGETVMLTLVESPLIDTHPQMSAVADANGNIVNTQFSPDAYDVSVRFYLTAIGSQSGFQAQNTFTDGSDTVTGTVRSSASGNPAIPGATVACTSGCSGGSNSTTSLANGSYSLPVNYGGNSATIDVTASASGFNSRTISNINVSNGNPVSNQNFLLNPISATNSAVSASPTSVADDGVSTSTITVTVKDTAGTLAANKTVTLSQGGGSSTITTVNGTTNANGQATFTVKDTKAESVTYTATVDALVTISQTAQVTFTTGPVSAGASKVVASPTSVLADGTSSSTITVTLNDPTNNPVSGKTVTLTAASGSSTITTVSGTTNASGQATFSVKDLVAESVTYTAKDSTDNVTATQQATVTFTAGAANAGTSTVVANPTSVTANGTSTSTITVTLKDVNSNPVSGKAVSLTAGSGSSTVTVVSGTTNASGQASFTVKDTVAESVTYTAKDTTDNVTVTQTAAVTFTAGAAAKLVFNQQPTNTAATLTITPAIIIQVQDANGNPVTTSTAAITVAIGTNPGSGTLSGTLTLSASAGNATFNNLSINKAGTGYTLTASSTGLTSAASNPFNITAGAATTLAFSQQPSNSAAGSSIAPPITVQIQDAGGNPVSTSSAQVTMAIGANPGSGTLSGTLTQAAVAGVATFGNLSINKTGVGYTLSAASTGLTGATSAAFNVTPGALDHFTISAITSPQTAGQAFAITVTAFDANNNIDTNFDANGNKVNLTSTGTLVYTNPSPAFTSGVLANQSVSITNTGSFTITATGTGNNSSITGVSNSFTVNPGPVTAGTSSVVASPTSVVADGSSISTITVTLKDGFGNPVSGKTVSLAALGGSSTIATLSGTSNASGQATFSAKDSVVESVTYRATDVTDANLPITQTATVNFTVGPVSTTASTVVANPTQVIADGSSNSTIAVTLKDGFNHLVSGKTVSLTANGGTSSVITAISAVTNLSGQASFSVTDTVPEMVTYTARDTTDTITITQTATVNFISPATTTTVAGSPNPSTFGQNVVITATVTSATGTPQGTLSLYGGVTPCAGTLLGSSGLVAGVTTFNVSTLNAGSNPISACYTPSDFHQPSNGSYTQDVNQATPSFTWNNPADISYGTPLSSSQLNATAGVPGVFVYTPAAGTVLNAGNGQTLSVVFTPSSPNYATVSASVSINVLKATPIVVWDNPADITYGTALGTTQQNAIALPPASALTGWWAGENNANDSAGTNNGTVSGVTFPAGKIGQAFSFSGVGDSVVINANSGYDLTAPGFTAGFWLRGSHSGPGLEPIVDKSYDSSTNNGWAFQVDGSTGHLEFEIGNGTSTDKVTSTLDILDGKFHYVTGTWDSTTNKMSLYIDGGQQGAATSLSGSPANSSGNLGIGYDPVNGNSFTGLIDEVQIFGRPLPGGSYVYNPAPGTVLSTGNGQSLSVIFNPTDTANLNSANATVQINVIAAVLTVTADDVSRQYGDPDPNFTFQVAGFQNGDTARVLTSQPNCSSTATASSPASPPTYPITCSGAAAANYTFSYVSGALTITKAHLTVTANDQSRAYGAANPSLTATLSGFKNGETSSVVSGAAACTTTAVANSPVPGPYPINCTQGTLTAANYDFTTFVPGSLTITTAHLTVTANDKNRQYGVADPAFDATITGFVNSETLATSGVTGTANCSTTAGPNSPVPGPYPINCTLGTLSATNYDFTTFVPGSLTITPAHLTVTANNKNRQYGVANPVFDAMITGFVNGEIQATSGVTGAASCTTAAVAASPVPGPYPINCTLGTLSATNYDFTTFVPGSLTITPAHLTVTAKNKNRQYGAPDPTFDATITGFVNGETPGTSGVTGTASCTTTAVAASPVPGPYPINCTLGTLAATNYDFSFVAGNLTITAAHLTVTANNKNRQYGASDPAFDATISGFVNGEMLTTSGVTGAANCTTTAVANSSVPGPYPINCTQGTLSASNYDFTTFVPGSLTITPAPLTIQADNKAKGFGQALPNFTVTYITLLAGDTASSLGGVLNCSTTAVPLSPVGSYPIICSGQTSTNYTITYQPGTLTIAQATTSVTVTSSSNPSILNAPVTFTATIIPQFSGTPTGTVTFKDGANTLSTVALNGSAMATYTTSSLAVNTHTITAIYSGDSNFTGNSGSIQQVVHYMAAGTMCAGDAGHAIRQPINPDGSSVFKMGSTVPTKVAVCDANGNSIGTPGVITGYGLVAMANSPSITVDETVYSTTPDTAFRWDPTAMQWIFNQSTKNNGSLNKSGVLYYFVINLNDGTSISFAYALK